MTVKHVLRGSIEFPQRRRYRKGINVLLKWKLLLKVVSSIKRLYLIRDNGAWACVLQLTDGGSGLSKNIRRLSLGQSHLLNRAWTPPFHKTLKIRNEIFPKKKVKGSEASYGWESQVLSFLLHDKVMFLADKSGRRRLRRGSCVRITTCDKIVHRMKEQAR